jgi:hypothetical protein
MLPAAAASIHFAKRKLKIRSTEKTGKLFHMQYTVRIFKNYIG